MTQKRSIGCGSLKKRGVTRDTKKKAHPLINITGCAFVQNFCGKKF